MGIHRAEFIESAATECLATYYAIDANGSTATRTKRSKVRMTMRGAGGAHQAAQLLKRMLALGVSKFDPDPLAAVEKAKRLHSAQKRE
jgi:hypothetical protein